MGTASHFSQGQQAPNPRPVHPGGREPPGAARTAPTPGQPAGAGLNEQLTEQLPPGASASGPDTALALAPAPAPRLAGWWWVGGGRSRREGP